MLGSILGSPFLVRLPYGDLIIIYSIYLSGLNSQAMAASTSLRRLKSQRADTESALLLAKAAAKGFRLQE